jgi:GNAT superfamily N-acetyltransferase
MDNYPSCHSREHLAMRIRSATAVDALAIATVHVRSWQTAYPGLIPQDYLDGLRPEDRVGGWRKVLASTDPPGSGVLVLVDGLEDGSEIGSEAEVIRGFCHTCPVRDEDLDPTTTGEVTTIYLAPEAWGAGNGLALLQASLARMVDAGFETASLWTLDTNARARRFYEKGGWKTDGVTKVHDWGSFVCTDVRYVLDLSSWNRT